VNTLSFTLTDDGPGFVLLVDGEPIGPNLSIPYYDIDGDLPNYWDVRDPLYEELRVLGMCCCGEQGCGHVRCRVVRSEYTVTLRDFRSEFESHRWEDAESPPVIVLSRANYDAVVAKMTALARELTGRPAQQTPPCGPEPAHPARSEAPRAPRALRQVFGWLRARGGHGR